MQFPRVEINHSIINYLSNNDKIHAPKFNLEQGFYPGKINPFNLFSCSSPKSPVRVKQVTYLVDLL